MILKLGVLIVIAYVFLAVAVFFAQRRLLYFPGPGDLSERFRLENGLRFWPGGDNAYRGFIGISGNVKNGTIVVFHGNAGAASDRLYYIRALEPLGYRVVLAEYPGYGGRPGEPGERVFAQDARETIERIKLEYPGPVYLWGESLGAGVVSTVVSDPETRVDGLVLLTPWSSLAELAQSIYWYLPVRWLLLDRFDNVQNLQQYRCPVAIVVAGTDEIVPEQYGLRLFESIQGPVRLWKFEHSGHNNWPIDPNQSWWKEAMNFVSDPETVP